ncbi:MAG: SagB/ThcOx family dehydrogenase [Bacteroidota bacterium]
MKKVLIIILLSFSIFTVYSQKNEIIKLPDPNMTGGMPLMEALKNRQTQRDFGKKQMTIQQISDLLWAASGINRPESGKKTAPSAVNWQEIDIYVSLKDGAYLYNTSDNTLVKIHGNDIRSDMGKQAFTSNAQICLAYVADYKKMKFAGEDNRDFYSATDTGFISQNVYLYCASEGLATVVLGYINRDKIHESLQLNKDQKIILTQCVGYPKEEFESSDE